MANRSRKKPAFIAYSLIKAVNRSLASQKNAPIKTMSRSSTIVPEFVGLTIEVYNGKQYIPVDITEDKIDQKLGSFSPTRKSKRKSTEKKSSSDSKSSKGKK
jgi:small subunit ribosomal protein S19